MITSSSNQQIKNVSALQKKKKERDEQQAFVVEGRRMFDEVKRNKAVPKQVYVTEAFAEAEENRELLSGVRFETVSDKVFESMAETVTPQGVIAVVTKPAYSLEDIIERKGRDKEQKKDKLRLLILEDVQDPGNVGTMMRTAEAAGMDMVILTRGSADIFSPKVVRSTMGSIFRVPFIYTEDLHETIKYLKDRGVKVYGSTLPSSKDFRETDYSTDTAVIVGNEGNGMTEETVRLCDGCVRIPMKGQVESLNAAVAAALLMFEMGR